jgi:hypothetical protein
MKPRAKLTAGWRLLSHALFCFFISSSVGASLHQETSAYRLPLEDTLVSYTYHKADQDLGFQSIVPTASVIHKLNSVVGDLNPKRNQSESGTWVSELPAKWQARVVSLGLLICLVSGPLLFAVVGTKVWESLPGQGRSRRLHLSLLMPLSLWSTVCLLILTLLSL